jgi:hypothetical protein
MDFSLRVNRKQIATNSSPFRDQQFQHISSLRERFRRQGLPIISVDSKKREMIGNFKNSGVKWDRSPTRVNDHDFLTDASGVGISYGIYDTPNNRGTVCVGVSHDTPAFAAHSIATWWKREGSRRHSHAPKLLVLADSGGSNGCTSWAWKTEIQAQLCNPFGIIATIAHYPTVLPNGIPSNTACSPKSPNTGLPSHWSAMKRCSALFAIPAPKPACLSPHIWTDQTIQLASNRTAGSFPRLLSHLPKLCRDGITPSLPICKVIFE